MARKGYGWKSTITVPFEGYFIFKTTENDKQ